MLRTLANIAHCATAPPGTDANGILVGAPFVDGGFPNPPPPYPVDQDPDDALKRGLIIGGACLGGVLLLALIIHFIRKRSKQNAEQVTSQYQTLGYQKTVQHGAADV